MDRLANPYRPGAGTQPDALVGRDLMINDFGESLRRALDGRPGKSCMLLGLRGTGKTVLLNRFMEIAGQEGVRTAFVEASDSGSFSQLLAIRLRRVLLQLAAGPVRRAAARALRALRSFALHLPDGSAISVGVEAAPGVADSGVLSEDLADLLVAAGGSGSRPRDRDHARRRRGAVPDGRRDGRGDSGHPSHDTAEPADCARGRGDCRSCALWRETRAPTRSACSPSQRWARSRARRSPRCSGAACRGSAGRLRAGGDRLDCRCVAGATRTSCRSGATTPGTPPPGSLITLQDVTAASSSVTDTLDRDFFRVRFDRLTPKERDYLRAMAELGPGPHRSGDIASELGVRVQSVAPRRSALIAKGMIYSPAHGDTAFTVPLFDDFLRRTLPK